MSEGGQTEQQSAASADAGGALPGIAPAGLAISTAASVREAASALLRGLAGCGRSADAVAWTDHGELLFEPPEGATAARRQAAVAAFSGRPLTGAGVPDTRLLPPGAADAGAVLLAPHGALARLEPGPSRLLALAGQRLAELFAFQRLHSSVKDLKQAEQLQLALFAMPTWPPPTATCRACCAGCTRSSAG